METIESYICGKWNDNLRCEDGFTVTADYAAVVDGSTSKLRPDEKAPYPDRSAGRMAMETVLDAVRHLPPSGHARRGPRLTHRSLTLSMDVRRSRPPVASPYVQSCPVKPQA